MPVTPTVTTNLQPIDPTFADMQAEFEALMRSGELQRQGWLDQSAAQAQKDAAQLQDIQAGADARRQTDAAQLAWQQTAGDYATQHPDSVYALDDPMAYYKAFGTIPVSSLGKSYYGIDPNTWATDTAQGAEGIKYLSPEAGATYTLYSPRSGKTLGTASTPEELAALTQIANQQTSTLGHNADWELTQTTPGSEPKLLASNYYNSDLTGLGKIVAGALPALAAIAVPGLGLVGGALGGALGAAGGTALSGALKGDSIGDILKNSVLAGGLSYGAGSLLGGTNAPSLPGAGGVAGNPFIPSGVGGPLGAAASEVPGEIVVEGARAGLSPAALAGIVAAAGGVGIGAGLGGSAATAGTTTGATTAPDALEPITVTGSAPAGGLTAADLAGISAAAGGVGIGAGLGTSVPAAPTAETPTYEPGMEYPATTVTANTGGLTAADLAGISAAAGGVGIGAGLGGSAATTGTTGATTGAVDQTPITVSATPQAPWYAAPAGALTAVPSLADLASTVPNVPASTTVEQPPETVDQTPITVTAPGTGATSFLDTLAASVPPLTAVSNLTALANSVPTVPAPAQTPTTPTAPKSTLDKLIDYLQIAGLGSGLLGGLVGSGSGSGATIPAGLFGKGSSSAFTGSLPSANLPGLAGGAGGAGTTGARTAADLAAQGLRTPGTAANNIDWYRYGYGPEQSFFNYVPQGTPNTSKAYTGYEEPLKVPGYAEGGYAVGGAGDGRDDKIPAMLSDGEYVMDAETVAMLGNGSNKAGAQALDRFRVNIRKQKGRDMAKGNFSAKAKSPEKYLTKGSK